MHTGLQNYLALLSCYSAMNGKIVNICVKTVYLPLELYDPECFDRLYT